MTKAIELSQLGSNLGVNGGSVGIGTNNPTRKLEIQTGTGIAGFKQSSSSLATTLEFLRNGAGTITNNAIEVSHSGGIASSLNYGGGAYFASNVGIGIGGNVGERLFVQGSPNTTFTNTPFLIKAYTDDDSAQNIGGGISLGGKWNGSAEQYADFGLISGIKENGTAGNYAGALTFATRPNGTGGGNHEKMRISSTGNVGINTTSPAAKLDIANSGNGASLLRFSTDRSWRFRQRSTGSTASLSLQAEVGNKYFNIENTNQEINLRMYSATDKTAGAFVVGEGLTRVPGIDLQNGYILVGTANYSSNQNKPILIAGATTWNGTTTHWGTYGFQMRLKSNSGGTARLTIDDNGGERLCVEGGGNVGIGTDNPVAKLHIHGLSVQTAGAFGSNVTYGGRTFTANHDIRATSMRGGVLVRNMNDYRSETDAASFMHYDAYTTSAKSYAFRVARGATLSDTFWVKSDGSMYTTGSFTGASISLTSNITQTANAPQHIFRENGTTYGNTTWAIVRDSDAFSIRWNNAAPYAISSQTTSGAVNNVALKGGQVIIDGNNALDAICVYNTTTSGGANINVHSSGLIRRSTSSAKYKTNVETIEDSYSDALLNCRPVYYRSTCENDNPDYGWWGFIAEEVAEIDPRLVYYKEVNIALDGEGGKTETPCEPEPEGVAYERFVPHLLNLIKRQKQAIETLETKVDGLLDRITALEGG